MEATGVFWKPLHRTLEEEMRIVVANPAHVKAILGLKTDAMMRHDWLGRSKRTGFHRVSSPLPNSAKVEIWPGCTAT